MAATVNKPNPAGDRRSGRAASLDKGNVMSIVTAAAIGTTGAFVGGALLTQTVIVPYWLSVDPATFLAHFRKYGPILGATLFPIELASTTLLGIVLYSAAKGRQNNRFAWGLAWSCMVGTLLLLPIYFLNANATMLSQNTSLDRAETELQSWYIWNWIRTALAFLAVISGCLTAGYRGRTTR